MENTELIDLLINLYDMGLRLEDLRSANRNSELSDTRQVVMYLLRATNRYTTTQIGNLLNRNHSTVIYGATHAGDMLKLGDKRMNEIYYSLTK